MKFYTHKIREHYEVILLGRENEVLFHIQAPQDTLAYWQAGFLKMMDHNGGHLSQFRRLVGETAYLHRCKLHRDASPLTFFRVMCALLKSLEYGEASEIPGRQSALTEICQLLRLNKQLNFRVDFSEGKYDYNLIINGQEPILRRRLETARMTSIPREWWLTLILECRQDMPDQGEYGKRLTTSDVRSILVNYRLLQEIVVQQAKILNQNDDDWRGFILRSFANFSKALIEFLDTDQSGDFTTFRWETIFDLCAFIVENEFDDLEEQKPYLERILESKDLAPKLKFKRLGRIVDNLREDARRSPTLHEPRLTAIIGAISEHYLNQYDLDQAASFWQLLDKKDWLLQGILMFYRFSGRFAASALLLTSLVLLQPYLSVLPGVGVFLSWLAFGILSVTFSLILLVMGFISWRFFISRRGLDYVEMLLPRFLGASVAGLSVLLVEDTVWRFSQKLGVLNWILICLAVYILSFVYIFIDVHKILRLLPLPGQFTVDQDSRRQNKAPKTPDQNINPMQLSIAISLKVFAIGLFETFLAVLFTSALFYKAILTPDEINLILAQNLGFEWQVGEFFSFGFFPKLVLLWTGLVIFIGAFVQLIWQDRRITST